MLPPKEPKEPVSPEEKASRIAAMDAGIDEYLNEVTPALAIMIVIAVLLFFTIAL